MIIRSLTLTLTSKELEDNLRAEAEKAHPDYKVKSVSFSVDAKYDNDHFGPQYVFTKAVITMTHREDVK